MHYPPFCPYQSCIHYGTAPSEGSWYLRAGSYPTKAFGRVPRYRCRACKRYFSDQTFALDYFVKHPLPYRRIFHRLRSASGIRSLSRDLEVSCSAGRSRGALATSASHHARHGRSPTSSFR